MKRIFFILVIVLTSLSASAQQLVDIYIHKSNPKITLSGLNSTAAQINLNSAGLTSNYGSGLLTLSGVNFNLGANSLLGSGNIGTTNNRFANGYFINIDFTNAPTIQGVSIFNSPPFTGTINIPNSPVNAGDAVNKSYVDARIALGLFWVAPCEDIVSTLANSIPVGKRYILSTNSHIYTSNGDNTWADGGATATGTTSYVKADANIPANSIGPYNYNGSAWVSIGISGNHNDLLSIQGGTTNEYYHLTAAEHTFFQSLPAPGTTSNLMISNGTSWLSTTVPTWNQSTTGTSAKATILATARSIYGNSFDGSASLSQIISSVYGGTGNGFTKFSGPATSEKTFTLPNVSSNILTDNSSVTVAQGGTGRATGTTPYGIVTAGTTATGAQQTVSAGSTGQVLRSGGASALPAWSTATYPATASTAGKIPISDGTNIIMSTPTYPNASPVSGTIIKGDGTNFVTSTETYDTPGAIGQVLMSDGNNWVSSALPAGGDVTTTGAQTLTNKTLTLPKINENVQTVATSTDINTLVNGALFNNTSLTGVTDISALRVGGINEAKVDSIAADSAGIMMYVNGSPTGNYIPPGNRISISTVLAEHYVDATSSIQGQLNKNAAAIADSTALETEELITIGDTTVMASIPRIVFKTSDSHLYLCKKISGKKWYQLDN
jgi:hypothetical protein